MVSSRYLDRGASVTRDSTKKGTRKTSSARQYHLCLVTPLRFTPRYRRPAPGHFHLLNILQQSKQCPFLVLSPDYHVLKGHHCPLREATQKLAERQPLRDTRTQFRLGEHRFPLGRRISIYAGPLLGDVAVSVALAAK